MLAFARDATRASPTAVRRCVAALVATHQGFVVHPQSGARVQLTPSWGGRKVRIQLNVLQVS